MIIKTSAYVEYIVDIFFLGPAIPTYYLFDAVRNTCKLIMDSIRIYITLSLIIFKKLQLNLYVSHLFFVATVLEENTVVAQRLAKKDLAKPTFYTFTSGGYGKLSIYKQFA